MAGHPSFALLLALALSASVTLKPEQTQPVGSE